MDDNSWARLLADLHGGGAAQPARLCEWCVEELGISGAGISMVTATGNRGVVCTTDEVSARIEDLQLTLGEGPCVDAVTTGSPVLLPDLDEPDDIAVDRWPAFWQGAQAVGVRALFVFPLRVGAIGVGAMDLYRDKPGELSAEHLPVALRVADAAALALLRVGSGREGTFADDPGTRFTNELQVHQATGMVQVQLGVTTEQAFALLRARAFANGQPLAELATDVVARRVRFSTDDA